MGGTGRILTRNEPASIPQYLGILESLFCSFVILLLFNLKCWLVLNPSSLTFNPGYLSSGLAVNVRRGLSMSGSATKLCVCSKFVNLFH